MARADCVQISPLLPLSLTPLPHLYSSLGDEKSQIRFGKEGIQVWKTRQRQVNVDTRSNTTPHLDVLCLRSIRGFRGELGCVFLFPASTRPFSIEVLLTRADDVAGGLQS